MIVARNKLLNAWIKRFHSFFFKKYSYIRFIIFTSFATVANGASSVDDIFACVRIIVYALF